MVNEFFLTMEDFVKGIRPSCIIFRISVEGDTAFLDTTVEGDTMRFEVFGNTVRKLNQPVMIPGT